MDNAEIRNQFLRHASVRKTLSRGETIDKIDTVFLILSGAVTVYIEYGGKEILHEFGLEGEFVANPFTYAGSGTPAIHLRCLRKTEVVCIDRVDMEKYVSEDFDMFRAFTKALETVIARQTAKELMLHEPDPGKRIDLLTKFRPDIFQQVPMKYIARYMGMAPETLSRQISKSAL